MWTLLHCTLWWAATPLGYGFLAHVFMTRRRTVKGDICAQECAVLHKSHQWNIQLVASAEDPDRAGETGMLSVEVQYTRRRQPGQSGKEGWL
jgi:hypothetical protein